MSTSTNETEINICLAIAALAIAVYAVFAWERGMRLAGWLWGGFLQNPVNDAWYAVLWIAAMSGAIALMILKERSYRF